jgi:hypothetical protein
MPIVLNVIFILWDWDFGLGLGPLFLRFLRDVHVMIVIVVAAKTILN